MWRRPTGSTHGDRAGRRAVDRLASLVQWRSDRAALASLPLAELQARASGLVSESHRAARWGAFVAAMQEARETIAAPLVDLAEAGRVSHADLPRALRRAFWFAWLARCVEARPALARFHALTHEQRVQEFRDLDRRVLADNRARLVASLRARVQTSLRDEAVEAVMPVLRREMAKQRNHRPIRETLRQAAPAVRAIKPVFLMSPLSVAQFTKGDSRRSTSWCSTRRRSCRPRTRSARSCAGRSSWSSAIRSSCRRRASSRRPTSVPAAAEQRRRRRRPRRREHPRGVHGLRRADEPPEVALPQRARVADLASRTSASTTATC